MPTSLEEHLDRIEKRQERIIQGIVGMADATDNVRETMQLMSQRLTDLDAWLRQPSGTELADTLVRISAQITEVSGKIDTLATSIATAISR